MDLSVAEYQLLQKYALHVKVGRCRTCVQTVKDHWLTLSSIFRVNLCYGSRQTNPSALFARPASLLDPQNRQPASAPASGDLVTSADGAQPGI